MKQQLINYTVIIEKQKRTGTNKTCYSALVPILGIAADGDTLEEVQKNIQSLVNFHLQSLVEEGEAVPVESTPSLVTRFETEIPQKAHIVYQ